MLRSLFCSQRLHLFDQKHCKNYTILKYYYHFKNVFFVCEYIIKCNLFLWCKADFSESLFQSSEIILICWFAFQETFLIIINVENCFLLHNIFALETMMHAFMILWWIESLKEQHLFEIEIFYNIINIFAVSSGQFNASLPIKSINFLIKNYWCGYWNAANQWLTVNGLHFHEFSPLSP